MVAMDYIIKANLGVKKDSGECMFVFIDYSSYGLKI